MRRVIVLSLAVILACLLTADTAQAAAQFAIWPGRFTYGTPSGNFTWNATAFGLRLDQSLGPFVGLGASIFYGPISNLSFGATALSSTGGQTLAGDIGLRLGTTVGALGVAAYAGYGGLALNATGPAAADRVVLVTSGIRLGAEAKVSVAPGLALRGNWTTFTGLNSSAAISLTSPPVAAQFSGTGSGSEYEVGLLFSPVPRTSIFAGYRAGTYQTTWAGSGATTTTFNGFTAGAEFRF